MLAVESLVDLHPNLHAASAINAEHVGSVTLRREKTLFLLCQRRQRSIDNCAQPNSNCSLRTRPPELFGLEPFYTTVAITLAASSKGNCDHFDCAI